LPIEGVILDVKFSHLLLGFEETNRKQRQYVQELREIMLMEKVHKRQKFGEMDKREFER
jgi:hypothetical protein